MGSLYFSFVYRIGLALVMAVSTAFATTPAAEGDASLRADLGKLASMRIYFGHQSVGDNLLAGVRLLAQDANVKLNIAQIDAARDVGPSTFAHTYVAENTQPLQKLKSFEAAMGTIGQPVDLAALKFCYVDFNAQTDAQAIFAQYQASIARIRAKNPGLTVVHITSPLTSVQQGIKAQIKRMLGKAPQGILENIRREQYNALMRAHYAGKEPLFDIARAESTRADGSLLEVEWNGAKVPALVPAYSDDGQHLNPVGQRLVARHFLRALASHGSK